jgi:hypothetical protein
LVLPVETIMVKALLIALLAVAAELAAAENRLLLQLNLVQVALGVNHQSQLSSTPEVVVAVEVHPLLQFCPVLAEMVAVEQVVTQLTSRGQQILVAVAVDRELIVLIAEHSAAPESSSSNFLPLHAQFLQGQLRIQQLQV